MKLRAVSQDGQVFGYSFYCPGCKGAHLIYTNYPGKLAWEFNGNLDKPTFSPSLLIHGDDAELRQRKIATNWPFPINLQCHSVITDGMINFCGDCEHELAGKSVEMPEWPYGV